MSILNLIVQVQVPVTKGNAEIATGMWVTDDYVLTSRHAVSEVERDVSRNIKIYYAVKQGKEKKDLPPPLEVTFEDVAWEGKDLNDAVLLKCPKPESLKGTQNVVFLTSAFQENAKWDSRGFPGAAAEKGNYHPAKFLGDFIRDTHGDRESSITVTTYPNDIAQWGGASGMPILINGRFLLSIAKEASKGFGAKVLYTVPICCLWQDEEFRELVDPSEELDQEMCTKLQNDTNNILNEYEKLPRRAFERILGRPSDCHGTVGDIFDMSPGVWLQHLFDFINLEDAGLEKRVRIRIASKLINVTLPAFTDQRLLMEVEKLRNVGNYEVVSLNLFFNSVAEIAMARSTRHSTCYKPVNLEDFLDVKGAYSLDTPPNPGRNIGRTSLDLATDIENHLHEGLLDSLIDNTRRPHFEKMGRTDENYIRGINRMLERRSNDGDRPYYLAVDLTRYDQSENDVIEVMKPLKKSYPNVIMFTLSDDHILFEKEEDEYYRLPVILKLLHEGTSLNEIY